MFQNSLINRIPIKCPQHPNNFITHFCVEAKCQVLPLFCEECMSSYRFKQKHYGHQLSILQLEEGIQLLCQRMEASKPAVKNMYAQLTAVKGAEGLLKWQKEKQQHFNSIENHINTIMYQIDEEIIVIVNKFQQRLRVQKEKVYVQLQNYFKNYKEKFDCFSKLIEPFVAMNQKFKFYANPNALFLKIGNQMGQSKLGAWLNDLKKTLNQSEKAAVYPGDYLQKIRIYGESANQLIDQLPRIRHQEYEALMENIIGNSTKQLLRSFVHVKEMTLTKTGTSMRSSSLETIGLGNGKVKHSNSTK